MHSLTVTKNVASIFWWTVLFICFYIFSISTLSSADSVLMGVLSIPIVLILVLSCVFYNLKPLSPYLLFIGVLGFLTLIWLMPDPFRSLGIILLLPLVYHVTAHSQKGILFGIILFCVFIIMIHFLPVEPLLVASGSLLLSAIIAFIITIKNKNLPKEETELKILDEESILSFLQKNIWVSICLLMILLLPLYGSVYHYGGTLTGMVLMIFITPFFIKFFKTKSQGYIRFSGFVNAFLFLLILGLHARTFEWYAFLTSLLLVVLAFLIRAGWQGEKWVECDEKKYLSRQKNGVLLSLIIMLVFVLSQIPAGYYWYDRLREVSMPEELYTLALGQYFVKNLTIPAFIMTMIAGWLYLKRSRTEEKTV